MTVTTASGTGPFGVIRLPSFEISASHDLTETPDLFGIRAALDTHLAHFSGIARDLASTKPLSQSSRGSTASVSRPPR